VSLFNYIKDNGLDIMNSGNRPTFVTSNRQEVIDITIATFYAGNFVKDWQLSEKVSCSDHRHVRFTVTGIDRSVDVYRNSRKTDRESFKTDLSGCLSKIVDEITNYMNLEVAARQFQGAVVIAYEENCSLSVKRNRNVPGGNRDRAEMRRKVRRLFNAAKKSGNWTDCNKGLRQAKRGGDTARRLGRFQNVPDYIGFYQRVG
jgi:hypothetical protein